MNVCVLLGMQGARGRARLGTRAVVAGVTEVLALPWGRMVVGRAPHVLPSRASPAPCQRFVSQAAA